MDNHHLLVKTGARAGILKLNRPQALNALSFEMLEQLSRALAKWQQMPEIYGVVLEASGDGYFCAGGDIREIYERGRKEPLLACEYLRREYSYNWQLECFTKPHISLMDARVLGGGVGISLYGTHRVGGSGFSLAMPETAIGFVPDVGGSWFLGHLPYSTGLYLALTGRAIGRADALHFGLLTHTIDSRHFRDIRQAVSEGEPIDSLLDDLQEDPGERELAPLSSWIEAVFSASTIEEIFRRARALEDTTKGWSGEVLEELQKKSPTSLLLAHRLWKKGRNLNLRRALEMEYRVVSNLMHGKEFYEGVRAMIIDKDRQPRWQPESIAAVSKKQIDGFFNVVGSELKLPLRQGG